MSHQPPEQEKNVESDSFGIGGQIFERFENGNPKKWRCGRNEQGELIDPPGVIQEDVVHTTIGKNQFGRIAPGTDAANEIGLWRTDWSNPVDENDKPKNFRV